RDYQTSVYEVLVKITDNKKIMSGNKLWTLINGHPSHHKIRIIPPDPFMLMSLEAIASTGSQALQPDAAAPVGGELANHPEFTGSGGGSDVVLRYHPIHYGGFDTLCGIDTDRNLYQADDVLFHELFHALRQMSALFLQTPMNEGFGDVEEFFAVLVTNLYTQ